MQGFMLSRFTYNSSVCAPASSAPLRKGLSSLSVSLFSMRMLPLTAKFLVKFGNLQGLLSVSTIKQFAFTGKWALSLRQVLA